MALFFVNQFAVKNSEKEQEASGKKERYATSKHKGKEPANTTVEKMEFRRQNEESSKALIEEREEHKRIMDRSMGICMGIHFQMQSWSL